MSDTIKTPWTKDQTVSLNRRQLRGDLHPYTCGNNSSHPFLKATINGWRCPGCGYTQDWAHAVDAVAAAFTQSGDEQ